MSSIPQHVNGESFDATVAGLSQLTDEHDHRLDPRRALHRPSDAEHAHSWLSKFVSSGAIEHIESRYHMGNFVIDRKTGDKNWEAMSVYVRLGMHLLYYGTYQSEFLRWKRTEDVLKEKSVAMGRQFDDSASKDHIVPFIESFDLWESLKEMKQPDPASYENFNQFFAREIRPEARPIDEPTNDLVASSPADCRLTAFQTIDLATRFWVKGIGFTLERLLGSKTLAQQFDGGSMVIARLAPQDYHRWHSPVDGTVENVTLIEGTYYTVNPQAINEATTLDVFGENKRSVMILKHGSTGSPVAVIAVGAMLVGSIQYASGVEQPGAQVKRGQCLGAFYYGGSTVIVLFPPGQIEIDQDLAKNSIEQQCETLMKVGWRVGEKKP